MPIDEKLCDTRHTALMQIAGLCSDKLGLRIDHIEVLMEERKETLERRLAGLNELRNEVLKDRDLFLRKEIYDEKTKAYDLWVTNTNEILTQMKTRYDSRIQLSTWLSVGSLLIAIVACFILLFRHG